jgi:hypothetical protein
LRDEKRLLGSLVVSDVEMREAAVVGDVDDRSGFWRGPSWWWMLEYSAGDDRAGLSGSKRKVNMNG